MQNTELRNRISSLVESVILTGVDHDTLLLESGLVDSLSAVDVAVAVEREFHCRIPASEIDTHLESVDSLARFVHAHQTVSP